MVDLLVERGFAVRVIDNLVGGRDGEPRPPQQQPDARPRSRATSAAFSRAMPVFAGANYVFHFAGIGDIVPSIERPMEYMSANVQGTVHMLECARARRRLASSSTPRPRPATASPTTPTREDHPIAPQYPYALSQVPGRAGGVPLAPGLPPAGQLDPHLQRLRHALAHLRRLRRGVRRVPAPEARRQAVHRGRRRHADARLPLCDRRGRRRSSRRRETGRRRASGTSAPATRSR